MRFYRLRYTTNPAYDSRPLRGPLRQHCEAVATPFSYTLITFEWQVGGGDVSRSDCGRPNKRFERPVCVRQRGLPCRYRSVAGAGGGESAAAEIVVGLTV